MTFLTPAHSFGFALALFALAGTFLALLSVLVANRKDRQEGYRPDAPTSLYLAIFLLTVVFFSPVLYASFPIGDPCYGLTWDNPFYWAYGCFWPDGK